MQYIVIGLRQSDVQSLNILLCPVLLFYKATPCLEKGTFFPILGYKVSNICATWKLRTSKNTHSLIFFMHFFSKILTLYSKNL